MLTETQKRNYEYFTAHLEEYLADPLIKGKVGVFYAEQLLQTFDSIESAAKFAFKSLPQGFVIQEIIDEQELLNYVHLGVAVSA